LNTFVTILLTILVFGFLIFIHEFGHFLFARIFHVTVKEFSIGMGPKLLWYDSQKSGTRYALAMFPFGGYVAMAGEDEESSDPNAFSAKPAWQRFIITAAGAAVNIVVGLLIMLILTATVKLLPTTTVHSFLSREDTGYEISTQQSDLRAKDTILAIDGKRVRYADDLTYEIMRRGYAPVDVTVLRDGEQIVLPNVVFPTATEQGQVFGMTDFVVYGTEPTFGRVISYTFFKTGMLIRMCWESIYDLITGRYTLAAVSGPVGISSAIGSAAGSSSPLPSVLYLLVMISINLGVMNLLPIPALDGGRLLVLLIEMISRRRLPAKLEGTINAVGLLLLLGLSFVILVKDVWMLFV